MAPQPLSRLRSDANVTFHPLALSRRPHHALLVGGIITTWSYVEAALGHLISDMMMPNSNIAAAMYSSVQAFEIQRSLLDTVMKSFLSQQYYELYSALMHLVTPLYRHRNKFAHRLTGISEELPESILLIESKELWKHRASMMEKSAKRYSETGEKYVLPEREPLNKSRVFVYYYGELEQIIGQMGEAIHFIDQFRMIVSPLSNGTDDSSEKRDERYYKLCSEVHLQEPLKKARKQTPSTQAE